MNVPFNDPEALEAQIVRQLPVISPQRDSLAVVLLTRWMRLAAAHGPAHLEVSHRRHQECWILRWQAPGGHTQQLEAPTLAELLVRVRAELPPGAPRRWTRSGGRSREPMSP
ncbi:MAG: hypothetical protein ACRERE_31540 [Candidatus Entotheonellia bacterium]